MALELTQSNFDETINGDKPVLVDFWASWCGPCRMVAPVIDSVAEEYAEKAVVGKVNVDDEGALAAQFGVASIPTVVLFKGGKEVKRLVGAQSMDDYCDMIDEVL